MCQYCHKIDPWTKQSKKCFTFCHVGNVARTPRRRELPLRWPGGRQTPPTASLESYERKNQGEQKLFKGRISLCLKEITIWF